MIFLAFGPPKWESWRKLWSFWLSGLRNERFGENYDLSGLRASEMRDLGEIMALPGLRAQSTVFWSEPTRFPIVSQQSFRSPKSPGSVPHNFRFSQIPLACGWKIWWPTSFFLKRGNQKFCMGSRGCNSRWNRPIFFISGIDSFRPRDSPYRVLFRSFGDFGGEKRRKK